jgi:hypothetical protein
MKDDEGTKDENDGFTEGRAAMRESGGKYELIRIRGRRLDGLIGH